MERHQSVPQRRLVIVAALDQWFARDVVHHVPLRRVEDLVIRPTRSRMHKSTGDAGNEEGIVNLQFDRVHQLLLVLRQHLV